MCVNVCVCVTKMVVRLVFSCFWQKLRALKEKFAFGTAANGKLNVNLNLNL